jgi:hypothetical protein
VQNHEYEIFILMISDSQYSNQTKQKRARFSPVEDIRLIELVKEHGSDD